MAGLLKQVQFPMHVDPAGDSDKFLSKVNVQQTNKYGFSLLDGSILGEYCDSERSKEQCDEIVKHLVQELDADCLANTKFDYSGSKPSTPLLMASAAGNKRAVQYMLENCKTDQGTGHLEIKLECNFHVNSRHSEQDQWPTKSDSSS